MRKILSIFLLSLAIISCQKEQYHDISDIIEINTIDKTVFYIEESEALTFLPSRDSSAWTSLSSLQARFDACLVPERVLDKMSTEALVESLMHYPLNYIIFAYNDPMTAIDLIFQNSTLHQELASRMDAPAELTKLFSESSSDFEVKTSINEESKQLSYEDEFFLEYLISSDWIAGRLDDEYRSMLSAAVSRKIEERTSAPDKYSMHSLEPLLAIDEAEGLSLAVAAARSGEIIGTRTVYTPYGKEILAYIRNELTSDEITLYTNSVTENYTGVTIHAPATTTYNCHSYAWHMKTYANPVWIDAEYGGVLQLANYWTNDAYVECSEINAVHAYYSDGDHSAIVLSNGRYLSKWGSLPLVEHTKTNCPYTLTNIRFFNHRVGLPNNFTMLNNITVSGTSPVNLNESNLYQVSNYNHHWEYEWEVRFMDAPEPTPFELITDDAQCYLTCDEPGLYKVIVYGKYQGYRISRGQRDVTAYPM